MLAIYRQINLGTLFICNVFINIHDFELLIKQMLSSHLDRCSFGRMTTYPGYINCLACYLDKNAYAVFVFFSVSAFQEGKYGTEK